MAGLPVEADIRRGDASQCGESRPSFLDHLVAHAFNDIRDRVRYRANLAAMELTGRRNRGLQNRWQSGAVIQRGTAGMEFRADALLYPRSTKKTNPSRSLSCQG